MAYIKWVLGALFFSISFPLHSQLVENIIKVEINEDVKFQTIHNFSASDAWSAQFVGKWPEKKKNEIADLLFSTNITKEGSPEGIGLSAWRFNIGAGSALQGTDSGIKDSWRRAEGFLNDDGSYNWGNQSGQQWFLQAAKSRGVDQFIAFVNSPPVQLTKNGKAYSENGLAANILKYNYGNYAQFLTNVLTYFKEDLNIVFNYMSPFNEPQWEWKGKQEGSPWNNDELFQMTRVLDSVFTSQGISSKIEVTEAGAIDYLTQEKDKYSNRSNQIDVFFNPKSSNYIGSLKTVAHKIAGHSYFTTWDIAKLKEEREQIVEKLSQYPNLEYEMTEYCVLENNQEIRGNGRDIGMDTALYVSRVIHADLTIANTSAWHWWLAMSPYDFKDGLIYHDKEEEDGNFYESKLLWAFGNFSRFIRPGTRRIKVSYKGYNVENTLSKGVLISAYTNTDKGMVVVAINQQEKETLVQFGNIDFKKFKTQVFVTDKNNNLANTPVDFSSQNGIVLGGKSVTTLLLKPIE